MGCGTYCGATRTSRFTDLYHVELGDAVLLHDERKSGMWYRFWHNVSHFTDLYLWREETWGVAQTLGQHFTLH